LTLLKPPGSVVVWNAVGSDDAFAGTNGKSEPRRVATAIITARRNDNTRNVGEIAIDSDSMANGI
jgi:hypothetical protein